MYDFDNDGKISREDIHLLLSHVPINHLTKAEAISQEGSFTKDGGGLDDFKDRIES